MAYSINNISSVKNAPFLEDKKLLGPNYYFKKNFSVTKKKCEQEPQKDGKSIKKLYQQT